jgi:acyl-CoA thioesterase-1
MFARCATPVLLALLVLGCGDRSLPGPSRPATAVRPPVAAVPATSGPLVAFLGDSLTAGLGLSAEEAYPTLVGARLQAAGLPVRVLNAGVSGDTTAGGLRRLGWILGQHPRVIVVALGANDGLRGTPVEDIEGNLRAIVTQTRAAGAEPVLVGMQIPPNYGPDYAQRFADVFPRLARELKVPLVPFLLAGVGGISDLNQADGIHPTAAGQERVAANVVPVLRPLIAGLEAHGQPAPGPS